MKRDNKELYTLFIFMTLSVSISITTLFIKLIADFIMAITHF